MEIMVLTDFKVNRSKVLHALKWLQTHNKYFVNIGIDQSHLAQLPDDGYMNTLDFITLNDPTCSEPSASGIVENDPHAVNIFVRNICSNEF